MLGLLCVALIRRRKNQPLRLHHKLEEILHWTCRAPVVLGGVEIVYREGRILNLVQYFGDQNSCLLRGCGMDGLKLTIVIRKLPTARAVHMGTKSCTKILIFLTRFSSENLTVEDFVMLLMGKKS